MNILRRQRNPVYWEGKTTEVRRCSWFHKSNDGNFTPYEENIAIRLEDEYKIAFESNQWHRKVELDSGETVVFHAHDVLVLFPQAKVPDAWGNTPVGKHFNKQQLFVITNCAGSTASVVSQTRDG